MKKLKLIKKPSTDSFYKKEYYVNEKSQLHGEYKEWWDNGQLRKHCYYENDKLHGKYKLWYKNEQLWKHCYFINGKRYSWKQYKKLKIKKILNYAKTKVN